MAKFIMLIGLPGSGKSYIAEKTKAKMKSVLVVSSDEIRKELFGDENDQQNPEKVFETMRDLQLLERRHTAEGSDSSQQHHRHHQGNGSKTEQPNPTYRLCAHGAFFLHGHQLFSV